MNSDTAGFLLALAIIVAAVTGWVMNIVTVFRSDFAHITGALVVHVIGIFILPLGAIAGYF